MKYLIFILIFIGFINTSSAQFNNSFKRLYEIADGYIYAENYIDALPCFQKLDSMAPNNPNIQFYLGMCYLKSFDEKDKASKYLELASQNISTDYYGNFNEKTAPVFTYYFLGKAYFYEQKFDLALENFDKFRYYLTPEDDELIKDVNRQIALTYNARNLIANPIQVRIENLGKIINSEYPDYAPVMSPDQHFFIFTSRREGSTGGKKDQTGKYFEDIYIAKCDENNKTFSNMQMLPGNVNTSGHEASISMSWDGSTLFIYRDDKGDGNIYMSKTEDGQWSAAEKLGGEINTKYYENHACLSPDGETLYFVSSRPGGIGGKDIWMSKRIGHNKWGKAVNLGPSVNSEYNEDSPMILSDGKTLYFSSEGHECMGGYDIFYSILENGEWSFPRNIGYPLNTVNDDVFFIPTLDGKQAYYASEFGECYGDLDIYRVMVLGQTEQIAILNGLVKDTVMNVPLQSRVTVFDAVTNEIYLQTESDKESGNFSATLKSGHKYKVVITTADGMQIQDLLDIPYSGNDELVFYKPYYFGHTVAVEPDTILERINVGQRMGDRFVLRNVYFDFDKSTLRPESKTELDRLVSLLIALPDLKIEISGHTDNYGSRSYNKNLSENRAMAVVQYLVSAGIDAQRLTYMGYGFDQPIATNETDAGRQLNRRTEFRIAGSVSDGMTLGHYLTEANLNLTNNINANRYNDVLIDYNPRWYIIGGSFMFLKNAEKFRDELRAGGYPSAEIVGQNSTGSYRVSYQSFSSKDDALKILEKMKEEACNEGLWILQK
ncbi:MAG: OmpA family protein [Bacteroidales bacterium]|jgi:outer membrane protein OmpA-like peptidoglycan-associated protein/tetratricopeptide (TPR) repeat protein|nr:OmpA family protein [Bacteroidales bacterium]